MSTTPARAPATGDAGKHATLLDAIGNIYDETSRENANVEPSASTRMYQIGSLAAREYNLDRVIDPAYAQLHRNGDIHIHDLDYYFTINCMTHDLARVLEGFDSGAGYIRKPRRIQSAMALTAIVLQSAQNNMFGGQAIGFFDRALAPYAKMEFDRQLADLRTMMPEGTSEEMLEALALKRTEAEAFQAAEALVFNLNTMKSRSGNQVPFTSLNLGTDTTVWGRLVTRALLLAFKRGLGHGENPLFPNICFRVKAGVSRFPGDPNHDLFRLAMEVAAVRLNPTFAFMDAPHNAPYGDEVGYMGCRTRVIGNINGPEKISGRGNLSFTTINLPAIALTAKGDVDRFFALLEERMGLVEGQLLERYRFVAKFRKRDLPMVMQYYMGSEGMGDDDCIEPAIRNGSLSFGFIGLAETLITLTGEHHGQSDAAQELGLRIIGTMRAFADAATTRNGLNFSLIATPAEGLAGRFTAIDKRRFGVIPRVTERSFYTNSFHVPVDHPCTIDRKLGLEGPYHALANAGHISYIELPAPPKDNIDAVERILACMADSGIGYGGINFPKDFCRTCYHDGVIDGDTCPKCGGDDIRRTRRITGYMSEEHRFNDAKLAELKARVVHGGRTFYE